MKRLFPLLLAGLLLLLPLSCQKNAPAELAGTWSLDKITLNFTAGNTRISQDYKPKDLLSFSNLIPDSEETDLPIDPADLADVQDVEITLDIQEEGKAYLTLGLRMKSGTGVSQRLEGSYLRDGNRLLLTGNADFFVLDAAEVEIVELTARSLVLRDKSESGNPFSREDAAFVETLLYFSR